MSANTPLSGALQLLKTCGCAVPEDRILFIYDSITRDTVAYLEQAAKSLNLKFESLEVPVPAMHGQEPPASALPKMLSSTLILGLTSKSMAHTQARIQAAKAGARYMSLPEYSVSLLADSCLLADFRGIAKKVRKVSDLFSAGEKVRVTTALGTDIQLNIRGREGNYCPGFVEANGELGSPPDIESNVSPVETDSEGVIVVDGSIPYPGLGLLSSPITLEVRGGKIVNITGEGQEETIKKLHELFQMADPEKTKVLAECGIGFNDKASLCGIMLTDEGAAGTGHFGFGSNSTVGGKNSVPFHLDFVYRNPSIFIDGKCIFKDGAYNL
jgi:2,5-dihydroxypyridine 5,6-dioxygenase